MRTYKHTITRNTRLTRTALRTAPRLACYVSLWKTQNLKEEVHRPAEDPNNQGEDEFEEAEQQEPRQQDELVRAAPAGSQERVAQEEQLVVSGGSRKGPC